MNQEVCTVTWAVCGAISSAAGKSVRALRAYSKSNIPELKTMKEVTKPPRDRCRTEELRSAISPRRRHRLACPHQFGRLGREGGRRFHQHLLANRQLDQTAKHKHLPTSEVTQESRTRGAGRRQNA